MKIKLTAALVAATMLVSANAHAEVTVKTDGGLRVSDEDYSIRVGARIMYDYNKSEENGVTDEDGFDIRRARVYLSGTVAENWAYKTQFNTNGSGVEDLYIRYTGWGSMARLTIGNQKVPFGLEELTSSKVISVLERAALTEQYAVGRSESINLSGKTGNQTYSISAYTQDEVDADGESTNKEDIGFSARYTIAPIKTDTSVFHIGVAYRDIADESALGLELAAVAGPFHVQAEFADGDFGGLEEDAFYVQAGYVLTGQSRPYSGGVFGSLGGDNVWEAVVRYEDGYANYSDIELGRTDASSTTLGLNWYPHKNVKLGINYTDGESNVSDDDGSEFRVRFQLAF